MSTVSERAVIVTTGSDQITIAAPLVDGDHLRALYDIAVGALAEICEQRGITSTEAIEQIIPVFAECVKQELFDVPFNDGALEV